MAALSPSPNSSPSAVPPVSAVVLPSQPSTPLPIPPTTSSQPNASSPSTATPPTPTPLSHPPAPLSSPPPEPPKSSPPPPPANVPPLSSKAPPPLPSIPPESSPPPPNLPETSSPPPSPNPPSLFPPPRTPNSPASSPPPPSSNPPASSSPPPSPNPHTSLSPPPPETQKKSPPPPNPPESTPPPAPSQLPGASPQPPASEPPEIPPPPPPESKPPQISPPTPANKPPKFSPPTPPTQIVNSPDTASPPVSNSPNLPSPSPRTRLSGPPPSIVPPPSLSPPFPSQVPLPPLVNLTTNSINTLSKSNSEGNGGIGTGGTVAVVLILGLILLSLIGTAVWCWRKQKRKFAGQNGGHVILMPLSSSPKSDSALLKLYTSASQNVSGTSSDFIHSPTRPGGLGNSRPCFTYKELVEATNAFSMQNLLGEGGFGSVYKGYLADGREVAVKQLNIGGGQGEREFKAEVEIISRVHHRHLVSLVGYCISENQRLLVYDYVPNNNLYFHLHEEGRPVMDWDTRVKVAVGAARGIAYLHEDCHPRIIHRDIKSSNILLDNNFEAQVSDFGLAKLALDADTHVTTRVIGTFGYMAPEYTSSGKLTEKSDVYSFGVVLLELITGRKPVDASQPLGEESLVEWARSLLNHALESEDFKGFADPRLENNYVDREMFRMIEAAAACVQRSAAKRPRMGQVVRAFDNMDTSDLTNGMRVGESEIYNSAQQSAEIRLFQRMAFPSQDYSTQVSSQSSRNS